VSEEAGEVQAALQKFAGPAASWARAWPETCFFGRRNKKGRAD
jgi:hypothetical protein